jgi:putative ABC transport system permease protein
METERLNDILVTEGEAPRSGVYDIALSQGFYNANGFQNGDSVTLAIQGKRVAFAVCANVQTPEFVYIMPEGSLFPDDANNGVAYVPLDVLESLTGRTGEVNDIALRLRPGVSFSDLERDMQNALTPYGLYTLYEREHQASHEMLTMELESMQSMVGVIPVMFLLLGALVMSVVIKRMVEQQHAQIGLLKAFGYPTKKVLAHYMTSGIVIGFAASVIGGVMGALVSEYIAAMYAMFFVMPGISGAFSMENVLTLSLFALLSGVGSSLYGARSVLKLRAAAAMRPPAPPMGKAIVLERAKRLWKAFSSSAQMSFRNLFRAKSRSITTLVGLTLCYAITAAVFAFSPMIDVMMVDTFTEVQRFDYRITTVNAVRADTLERELLRLENVDRAEAVLNLAATARAADRHEDVAIMGIAHNSSLYHLYDEDNRPVALPENGVVLTYRMAKALRVSAGDTITLDFPVPDREIAVRVAVLSEQYTSNYVLASREFLAEALRQPDFANGAMFTVRAHNGAVQNAITETLHDGENIASILNTEQLMESTDEMLQTATTALNAMALMAMFTGFAIVYNGSVVILSERLRELASMRVLGFSVWETVRVVALEQAALLICAVVLGIPLTGVVMDSLAGMISTDAFAIPVGVPLQSHALTFVSMAAAWLLAMMVTKRKMNRIQMADVLKERD